MARDGGGEKENVSENEYGCMCRVFLSDYIIVAVKVSRNLVSRVRKKFVTQTNPTVILNSRIR